MLHWNFPLVMLENFSVSAEILGIKVSFTVADIGIAREQQRKKFQ